MCKIVNGLEENVVLSASWDKTVRMWKLSQTGGTCILTISKDEAAVWTVLQPKVDLIVTGSADKTIKLFLPNGNLVKKLTGTSESLLLTCLQKREFIQYFLVGHSDVVRDIAKLNDEEILSCANDATIRRWSLRSGECLETLYGHPNFIYRFVLCVENSHVKDSYFKVMFYL